ncbi:alanine racemase [Mycolicibacterium mengxianglii]|uniref:alanine racemase n=1 Tax=Mycolicibacterium mengxianglii TaxID=2736649 RepID=UPI0018EECBE3|nr:alanine racemase [Mycolicibacterium mengxianglii]
MTSLIDTAAVSALADQPLDWRFKGLPVGWEGRTPAQICAGAPGLFPADVGDRPLSPLCVLDADALARNLATMAQWCDARGVGLAPHGKTHMSPQLLAMQFDAGATAVTAATIGQVRTFRAFGVRAVLLANQLVDAAGLRWLAAEYDAHPDFRLVCWVDSEAGVAIMQQQLQAAGLQRPIDVCVEVGAAGARTGCRTPADIEAVARAAVRADHLRLAGVAGYEAALGHDVSAPAQQTIRDYLQTVRDAAVRLAPLIETDDMLVTAGGSTHFDLVAEMLTGWPAGMAVRTVLRSGAYLTHDDGLYARTSPLTRDGARDFVPALSVWAQVGSRPEPGLALVTMGRRDVGFDQDLPLPRDLPGSKVTALNDQHAFLSVPAHAAVAVGDWLQFGISHPCTTFDKWQLIPLVDTDNRVIDLIRTYF